MFTDPLQGPERVRKAKRGDTGPEALPYLPDLCYSTIVYSIDRLLNRVF